jgi:hypothetical protein
MASPESSSPGEGTCKRQHSQERAAGGAARRRSEPSSRNAARSRLRLGRVNELRTGPFGQFRIDEY